MKWEEKGEAKNEGKEIPLMARILASCGHLGGAGEGKRGREFKKREEPSGPA